jgi:hypothetical protein
VGFQWFSSDLHDLINLRSANLTIPKLGTIIATGQLSSQLTQIMHIIPWNILLSLVTLSLAFSIPNGTRDGVYKAYYAEDGTEVHEPIDKARSMTEETPLGRAYTSRRYESLVEAEQQDGTTFTTWCGCDITLNHGDCDMAIVGLKDRLGGVTNLQVRAWDTVLSHFHHLVTFSSTINILTKSAMMPTLLRSSRSE